MTTVAHSLSAGLIAVTAAGIAPTETKYVVLALVSGAIVDADHVYPVIRHWKHFRRHGFGGNLHAARSPLHELTGLVLVGILAAAAWPVDPALATIVFVGFATHLAQDFIVGRSIPFSPFESTEVQMFRLDFRHKVIIDICVIATSVLLWMQFLSGRP